MNPKFLRYAAPLAGVLGACALSGSASAATTQLGCSAALAKIGGVAAVTANPSSSPCQTDSNGITADLNAGPGLLSSLLGPTTILAPAQASTELTDSTTASASTTIAGASIPLLGAAQTLKIGPAKATAGYACVNGALQATASSTLSGITLQTLLGQQTTYTLSQLPITVGGVTITANQTSTSGNTASEVLLNLHSALGDVSVGQATAIRPSADPCGGGDPGPPSNPTNPKSPPAKKKPTDPGPPADPGSPTPSGPSIFNLRVGVSGATGCPLGTALIASDNACVLIVNARLHIYVSAPHDGTIVGGRVVYLKTAQAWWRKVYGGRRHTLGSSCLRGPGARFVVIGNNAANTITTKRRSLRILSVGGRDRVTVKSGNVCVDGGNRNDVISVRGGTDRVYGAAGNDRIAVANNRAFVSGGAGNDLIRTGVGVDRIFGADGDDVMYAHNARSRVNGGAGYNVAYVLKGAAGYARSHHNAIVHVMAR